jgi:hypothetical protein
MFMCRVLIGEAKVYPPGEKDPGLVREPERVPGGAGVVRTLRGGRA